MSSSVYRVFSSPSLVVVCCCPDGRWLPIALSPRATPLPMSAARVACDTVPVCPHTSCAPPRVTPRGRGHIVVSSRCSSHIPRYSSSTSVMALTFGADRSSPIGALALSQSSMSFADDQRPPCIAPAVPSVRPLGVVSPVRPPPPRENRVSILAMRCRRCRTRRPPCIPGQGIPFCDSVESPPPVKEDQPVAGRGSPEAPTVSFVIPRRFVSPRASPRSNPITLPFRTELGVFYSVA